MKKIIIAIVSTILLGSCHHKDLYIVEENLTKVRVEYDWADAPDASPAGMRVFFYSEDDSSVYYFFDLPGTAGGYVELPAGNYKIISYNNDTKTSLFAEKNSFSKHYCYTREGNILEPIYGNGMSLPNRGDDAERVVITPDEVYLCAPAEVNVKETGSSYTVYDYYDHEKVSGGTQTDVQVITLYPHDILCHYSYEVRNVKNIEHISQVSAALSGMSPSILLCDETLHTEPVTLPVPGAVTTFTRSTEKEISGAFLTFGQNAANGARHKMSFYVVMDDGSKYQFANSDKFDVTDQVVNAPDPRHVHIIIDGLDVPDPIKTGSGAFVPDVDNWGTVESEIDI